MTGQYCRNIAMYTRCTSRNEPSPKTKRRLAIQTRHSVNAKKKVSDQGKHQRDSKKSIDTKPRHGKQKNAEKFETHRPIGRSEASQQKKYE